MQPRQHDDDFGAIEGGRVAEFGAHPGTADDRHDAPLARLVRLPRIPLAQRIRERPGTAFVVAFGLGWLLAKATHVALRSRTPR